MEEAIEEQSFTFSSITAGDAEVPAEFLNQSVRAINRTMTGVMIPQQVRAGGIREVASTLLPTRETFRRVEFPKRLDLWAKGEALSAGKLNMTVGATNRLMGFASSGAHVRRDSCLPLVVLTRPADPGMEPTELKEWTAGELPSAEKLNAPGRALQKMYFGVRPPIQVKRDYFPCFSS